MGESLARPQRILELADRDDAVAMVDQVQEDFELADGHGNELVAQEYLVGQRVDLEQSQLERYGIELDTAPEVQHDRTESIDGVGALHEAVGAGFDRRRDEIGLTLPRSDDDVPV